MKNIRYHISGYPVCQPHPPRPTPGVQEVVEGQISLNMWSLVLCISYYYYQYNNQGWKSPWEDWVITGAGGWFAGRGWRGRRCWWCCWGSHGRSASCTWARTPWWSPTSSRCLTRSRASSSLSSTASWTGRWTLTTWTINTYGVYKVQYVPEIKKE